MNVNADVTCIHIIKEKKCGHEFLLNLAHFLIGLLVNSRSDMIFSKPKTKYFVPKK